MPELPAYITNNWLWIGLILVVGVMAWSALTWEDEEPMGPEWLAKKRKDWDAPRDPKEVVTKFGHEVLTREEYEGVESGCDWEKKGDAE